MTKILRIKEVSEMTSLSKTTIYSLIRQHKFPPNILIGAQAVGWFESDVLAFLEDRRQGRWGDYDEKRS